MCRLRTNNRKQVMNGTACREMLKVVEVIAQSQISLLRHPSLVEMKSHNEIGTGISIRS